MTSQWRGDEPVACSRRTSRHACRAAALRPVPPLTTQARRLPASRRRGSRGAATRRGLWGACGTSSRVSSRARAVYSGLSRPQGIPPAASWRHRRATAPLSRGPISRAASTANVRTQGAMQVLAACLPSERLFEQRTRRHKASPKRGSRAASHLSSSPTRQPQGGPLRATLEKPPRAPPPASRRSTFLYPGAPSSHGDGNAISESDTPFSRCSRPSLVSALPCLGPPLSRPSC